MSLANESWLVPRLLLEERWDGGLPDFRDIVNRVGCYYLSSD